MPPKQFKNKSKKAVKKAAKKAAKKESEVSRNKMDATDNGKDDKNDLDKLCTEWGSLHYSAWEERKHPEFDGLGLRLGLPTVGQTDNHVSTPPPLNTDNSIAELNEMLAKLEIDFERNRFLFLSENDENAGILDDLFGEDESPISRDISPRDSLTQLCKDLRDFGNDKSEENPNKKYDCYSHMVPSCSNDVTPDQLFEEMQKCDSQSGNKKKKNARRTKGRVEPKGDDEDIRD